MEPSTLILPNSVDPNHQYIFHTGEFGAHLLYHYQDMISSNYFTYSNAPKDHPDHDPTLGDPIMLPDQPFLHNAPQFFSPEGYKRNMAAPDGVIVLPNLTYNPLELKNTWSEYYMSEMGDLRYIYTDKDVKENLDLYIQHQIRVCLLYTSDAADD